ncbi:MAG TPA: hypothetical protein DCF68_20830 [Cyanothece sp. UBA12306]|nr:hypothetical protein [Cyanothece sp. UBA12306]
MRISDNLRNPIKRLFFKNSDENLKAKITLITALYNIREYNRFKNNDFGGITDLKFNPKTNLLAAAGEDGIIKLWDIKTGENKVFVDMPWVIYYELISSLDGQNLGAVYAGGSIIEFQLWDWESSKNIRSSSDVQDVFFSSSSNQITTFNFNGDSDTPHPKICWHRMDTQKVAECKALPEKYSLQTKIVDADNDLFVSSTSQIYNNNNIDEFWGFNRNIISISNNINFSKYICYLQKNKIIIGLDSDNNIIVLDSQLNQHNNFSALYEGPMWDVKNYINCLEDGQSFYQRDISNQKNLKLYDINHKDSSNSYQLIKGHENWNNGVSIHSNRKILTSGSSDGQVLLWRLDKTFNTLNTLNVPDMSDNSQVIDLQSDYLIYKENKKLKIFNLKEQKHIPISDKVPAEILNKDSNELKINYPYVINQIGNEIILVNLENGELETKKHNCNFKNDSFQISTISESEILTIVPFQTNEIYLWDVNTQKCSHPLTLGRKPLDQGMHHSNINSLDFNYRGDLLAAGNSDFIIDVWDINEVWDITKKNSDEYINPIHPLKGHTNEVTDVSFSPNDDLLASLSNYNTIKFWNARTGDLIETLKLDGGGQSITFNSDGTSLLVMTGWNTILEFNLTWDKLLEQGCDWMKDYIKTHPQEKELKKICRHTLSKSESIN